LWARDLANIINEAALLAAREDKETVEAVDFGEAIDPVVAGLQKKSRVMNAREEEGALRFETPIHAQEGDARSDREPGQISQDLGAFEGSSRWNRPRAGVRR